MKKILFICHGNICRSPMAEMIMKHLVRERGLEGQFSIASAATSTEEIGNPVYPPARAELARQGIPVEKRGARQLTRRDYADYDLLIGMDNANIRNMHRMLGGDPEGKIHRLMDFTDRPGEVSDPWYSDRFDIAYRDIREGCEKLLAYIKDED
ncbi:MAG: low molecular weight phosphotyrosine protein phosphatase [Clostridia bacterium]|nr:low molecular weight phosphotyrosine protein phosphatase [Clostridia bacterium]